MEKNKKQMINYKFRIGNLTPHCFDNLCRWALINKLEYSVGRYWKNKNNFVVVFRLNHKSFVKRINNFIHKNKISDVNYGISVSYNLSKKIEELKFSSKIMNLYRDIGGNIDFSYIYIPSREGSNVEYVS